jgi:hypothetical protein
VPLGVFTAVVLTFPLLSLAAPWSEQHAFCVDRMSISLSYYSNQKIYNECMENADALIAKSEKSIRDLKIHWEKSRIEQLEKSREENAKWVVMREAEKNREKRKNEQELKKYEGFLSEFD